MATIIDILSTDAPADSRTDINDNFDAINDQLVAHVAASNPHSITKSTVGLGNCDNTSDANKPISTATQTALDAKAPIAAPTFTGLVTTSGAAISAPVAMSGTVIDVTKRYNSYGATSDAALTLSATPAVGTEFSVIVSTDSTARTLTLPPAYSQNRGATVTSVTFPASTSTLITYKRTISEYLIFGDPVTAAQVKTALAISTSDVSGLSAALALKADLASPALTGTPTAPTASGGTNTTQVATTAFVQTAVSGITSGSGALEGSIVLWLRANAASIPSGWSEVTTVADYEELMFIQRDSTTPTVSSVSSGKTNGTYTTGELIPITIAFTSAVNVTGTPQLLLETGSTDRLVNYTSGSGTSILTFNYTVQSGDSSADLDYVSTSSLTLNGGTIKSTAAVDATLTLPSPGAAGSLGANKALIISASTTPAFDREDQRASTLGSTSTSGIIVATTFAVGKRAVLLIRTQIGIGVTSVSDSAGNTWAIDESYTRSGQSEYVIASAHMISSLVGGAGTITITWGSASYSYKDWALWQLSGIASSSAKDSSAEGEAFGSTISTSVTTVATNTCVVGIAGASSSPTYTPATFTTEGAAIDTGDELRLHLLRLNASSSGAKTPAGTYSGSVGWGCVLVAYK